jgi:hypothetical protein
VEIARLLAVFLVGGDEGCDCDGGRVGEELGDLYVEWWWLAFFQRLYLRLAQESMYLCYPADVLIAVLLGEAKVFVQSKAHIVAVKTVRAVAEVQEVLLEGGCDGGFARCR